MRFKWFGLAAALLLSFGSMPLPAQVNVTTYHNDNARTGQNVLETTLTPANVNSNQFGKLFSVLVDGSVYAQPLYVANLTIAGGTHNVLYVATQHDSVYAIDADTGTVYWQRNLIPAGGSPVNSSSDLGCGDITKEVGITGTPVIDFTTGTLYVVAKFKLNGSISQALHALDITNAAEKFGGPVDIHATAPGTSADGNGTTLTFDARRENQRAALLLENGHVVIAWASHCDQSPWHGWVISYSASTLMQEGVYNASPTGYAAGIWMSGSGMAADTSGNIYAATGNGTWNTTDRGDSILKLGQPANSTIPLLDYFTPYDQSTMSSNDVDMSAGGLILLPTLPNGSQLLTMAGKNGTVYLVDRSNLGQYCVTQTPSCTNADPNIVQEVPHVLTGFWGVPAYWNGNLYFGGGNDFTGNAEALKALSFNANGSGRLSTSPTSVTAKAFYFPGPDPSVSSNGTTNGIVWGLDNSSWNSNCVGATNCQVLYAYDATNLSNMLYNSSQAPNNRDIPGTAVKFTTPTVANGKVYVGGAGTVSVYGLLGSSMPATAAPVISPPSGTYTSSVTVQIADATPGAVIYYTTNRSSPSTSSATYTAPLTITDSGTVNAIAIASGYSASPMNSATYTIARIDPSGAAPVSLAGAYNVFGLAPNGSPVANGGLDSFGFAYSGNLLGSAVTIAGLTFNLGPAGGASAISGGTINLPAGNFTTLNFLGAGVQGNQVDQTFVVTYTDGTTTTLTQSMSDWTAPQNYPGEYQAKAMGYRIAPSGAQDNRQIYLYGYSFAINGAKTVKSLTLPNNRAVVVLAVTLSGATESSGSGTSVSLSSAANVHALFSDGTAVTNGGLDGRNYAYSATLLGPTVTWSGTTFSLGSAAAATAVSGATLFLPTGSFTALKLLATAVNGNQLGQTFIVTYTDGTTTSVVQNLSDWYRPQGYPGEAKAAPMSYRLIPTGAADNRTFYLYGYTLALNSAKNVKSITLPSNRNVVVLAATLSGSGTAPPPPAPTPVNLATAANVNAFFSDGSAVTNGGLDTHSTAYSGTLLGGSISAPGISYALMASGVPDAVSSGVVTLPQGHFSTLNMLATAANGNQLNQPFTVTYTDGTTTTLSQSLSDWFTPQGYPGETKASTMAYRLVASGATDNRHFYLYSYSLPIDNTRTVQSVTLPNNRKVVVLAMTLTP